MGRCNLIHRIYFIVLSILQRLKNYVYLVKAKYSLKIPYIMIAFGNIFRYLQLLITKMNFRCNIYRNACYINSYTLQEWIKILIYHISSIHAFRKRLSVCIKIRILLLFFIVCIVFIYKIPSSKNSKSTENFDTQDEYFISPKQFSQKTYWNFYAKFSWIRLG